MNNSTFIEEAYNLILKQSNSTSKISLVNDCNISEEEGCRKYRECNFKNHGLCWSKRTFKENLCITDNEKLNPFGVIKSDSLKGIYCNDCKDFNLKKPKYSYCPPSCPTYGCVPPGFSKLGCPYSNNYYRDLQCYITRPQFIQMQRDIQVYQAIFAYLNIFDDKTKHSDIRMYYQQKNNKAVIHSFFSTITSADKNTWSFDEKEHMKSYAFHITRTGLSAEKDFYNILTDKRCGRLSNFEKTLNLIYAPEGEMTSFLLGWLLRLYKETAKCEEQYKKWKYLKTNAKIKISFDIKNPIHQYIGDRISTSKKLLIFLGLVKNSTSLIVTEKWIRTLEWLIMIIDDYLIKDIPDGNGPDYQGYSNCFKSTHEKEWIFYKDKKDLQKIRIKLRKCYSYYKKTSEVKLRQNDFNFIIELLTSQSEKSSTFYHRARFTLPGHLILREHDLTSRAWLVFRIYDYFIQENVNQNKSNDVGFCLITFKDSDDHANSLDSETLALLIKKIRILFQLVSHAENNGFFVRKVIEKESSKEYLTSGIRRIIHIFNTKLNLLTGVKNRLNLLCKSPKGKDQLQQSLKDRVDELNERLQSLVNELRELKNKFMVLTNPMKRLRTDIDVFINNCISAFGNRDKYTISHEKEKNIGEVVCDIDPAKMELAIATLIENSIKQIKKHDQKGSGEIRIACSYSPDETYCQIRISDTGGGFHPDIKNLIDNNLPIKRADGFGLGLFIVKEIVDQHRGTLNIGNSDNGAIIMINLSNARGG